MCSSVSLLYWSHVCTGKYVLCLKASGSCNQSQNTRADYEYSLDLHNSLLMRGHNFTRITEKCRWHLIILYRAIFIQSINFIGPYKPTKCVFFSEDLEILWHCVAPKRRFFIYSGSEAILAMPRSCNVSDVNTSLAWNLNYFWDYVKNMASRTNIFVPFVWRCSFHEDWCSRSWIHWP